MYLYYLKLNNNLILFQTFFFVSLLFLYTAYTANIVSLLQATTKSIKTLEDMSHSQLEFGVEDTPYNRAWLPISTGAVRQEIYKKKIAPLNQNPKYYNMTYGISRVRQVSKSRIFRCSIFLKISQRKLGKYSGFLK